MGSNIRTTRYTRATIAAMIALAAGCASAPRYRNGPAPASVTIDDQVVHVGGTSVVDRAGEYLGAPYRNGGTTARGIDCSGLVYMVFRSFGIEVPRTSSEQAQFGASVERDELAPGDLIFFSARAGGRVTHVAIYSGRGEFIHASNRARRVQHDRLDNKYFRSRYVVARRVL